MHKILIIFWIIKIINIIINFFNSVIKKISKKIIENLNQSK